MAGNNLLVLGRWQSLLSPGTGDTEWPFKQCDLSATVQLSAHHNRVTIGVCNEVTGPFVVSVAVFTSGCVLSRQALLAAVKALNRRK